METMRPSSAGGNTLSSSGRSIWASCFRIVAILRIAATAP